MIALNILDHDRDTLPDGEFKRDFQLLDRDHLNLLRDGVDKSDPSQLPYLRIIQCELPRADLSTMPDCLLKHWLQLLKDSPTLPDIPPGIEEPVRKAYERLEFSKWGTRLQADYTRDSLLFEEYQGVLQREREGGLREGKEVGFHEGKGVGFLENKREVARKMLTRGAPLEDIMDLSTLSAEEIEALRRSM